MTFWLARDKLKPQTKAISSLFGNWNNPLTIARIL